MIDLILSSVLVFSDSNPFSNPLISQSNTTQPIECRDGFEWDSEKKMCLPKVEETKPKVKPSSGRPSKRGSFCEQYPQDPMCGGGIPRPVAPPKR